VILESLQPNGSFSFSKKPVVFPEGKLGLEVDTSGSCRLTAVEKAVAGSAGASALASKKPKKSKKGLIKKVTIYANGSGTHIIPLNLTPKAKKLLKKKKKGKKASASASQVLKDPLVITCTPIVYPVAGFTDGTQITGIGQAPVGSPPAGQPPIPSGPPTVQPGGIPVVKKPVVPLVPPPAQPASPPTKLYKASEDLDKTAGRRSPSSRTAKSSPGSTPASGSSAASPSPKAHRWRRSTSTRSRRSRSSTAIPPWFRAASKSPSRTRASPRPGSPPACRAIAPTATPCGSTSAAPAARAARSSAPVRHPERQLPARAGATLAGKLTVERA
jgi:hypothetical protein